ncbi:hypothetical protein F485_gp265 [Aeromonas phage CC2]|uniref:Uncharacterized protein n=1 Tax=Aeromonas phage CC2 TaxID=1204516 RepID=I6X6X9_9CAUD|nr:hypothetical protein F485_gp265 [Aeromonas phage CC2]AFN39177.1 hypothetical protein CC2_030 [Aeromonas phage CC2]
MDIRTIYYAFVDKGYANPQHNLFVPIENLSSTGHKVKMSVANTSSNLAFTYEDDSGILCVYIDGEVDFIPKVYIVNGKVQTSKGE